jgi:hypothetical protein
MRVLLSIMFLSCVTAWTAFAQALKCDMTQYKEITGLTAAVEQNLLVVTWMGQGGVELRARYAIEGDQPVVRELAIRKQGGQWAILGQNLIPEYHVVSGMRRFSRHQSEPLERELGVKVTQEVMDKYRWYAFHDAPLEVPGMSIYELPRKPGEIRRMDATFNTSGCSVKTDGARL